MKWLSFHFKLWRNWDVGKWGNIPKVTGDLGARLWLGRLTAGPSSSVRPANPSVAPVGSHWVPLVPVVELFAGLSPFLRDAACSSCRKLGPVHSRTLRAAHLSLRRYSGSVCWENECIQHGDSGPCWSWVSSEARRGACLTGSRFIFSVSMSVMFPAWGTLSPCERRPFFLMTPEPET